jgi:glutamine phosphoribosylpyrophosphate amidotransferase
MCAVIGIDGKIEVSVIKRLFIESQVRGRHATGVSFWKNGKVNTIKESLPADHFIEKYDPSEWFDGDTIKLIGHCRYSTSDLEYNQPISDDTRAVVHNGVITQELPELWEELYGVKCEGNNDTELLFRTSPQQWEDSSIAAIFLADGEVTWERNGKRPLWVFEDSDVTIVTSTKDIAIRSGINSSKRVKTTGIDLQP